MTQRRPYAPHEGLIAPARARPELWRLIVGMAVAYAVYMGLIYSSFGLAAMLIGADEANALFSNVFNSTMTARDAILLLASFLFMGVGTAVAAQLLQGRGFGSLIGPPQRLAQDFIVTLRALTLLYAVLWVVLPMGVELRGNLGFGPWLMLLPLTLTVLLIQIGAEELFFRGYLQQQLAARFGRPLIWLGLPAALFAWGHYQPGIAGENAMAMALWAGAFSLAAGDLTARTGTLGAAMALHFANNATSLLLVALPGPLSGLALYTYPYGPDHPDLQPLMLVELGVVAVSWLTCRVALRV